MSWDVGGGSFVSISIGGAVVVVRWRARKNNIKNNIKRSRFIFAVHEKAKF
jgi:hypothetical protein